MKESVMKNYNRLHETKSHSDTLFPYNTYLCSIPLDFTHVPPHWHTDIEIIVVTKGKGIVILDTKPIHVSCGDMVIVCSGRLHAIKTELNQQMEYENIIFNENLLYTSSGDRCTLEYLEPFFRSNYTFQPHIHEHMPCYAKCRDCIREIDCICEQQTPYYELLVKGKLFEFFFTLFTANPNPISAVGNPILANPTIAKMKDIITYVEQHYGEPISIQSAANYIGVSESYFMKIFKESMHITFTNYLNHHRLDVAGALLKSTSQSVLEIATNTGFANLSYFNRLFKAYYHMSPREYRGQF